MVGRSAVRVVRRVSSLPHLPPFRSTIRGPWLTSVFGAILLVALPVITVTGLLSYIAYGPEFGQARPAEVGWLRLPSFAWPTDPSWIYRLNQGLHVTLGIVVVPLVLAKLWSVMPRLVQWPPVRSPAQALERLTVLMLVGGVLLEIVTGVLNIQYDYIFGFDFYAAHYFGAWVFIAGFLSHVAIKVPVMWRRLRQTSLSDVLRERNGAAETRPDDEVSAPEGISRRGALALVAGGSGLLAALTIGQTVDGPLRSTALLLPRGRSYGDGPNDFQINRTAVAAGIDPGTTGDSWRVELSGMRAVGLDRAALEGMEQHTAVLPIACVEGWSTTQEWTGVRLRDLAALAGVSAGPATVSSLEQDGAFARATLGEHQVWHPDSLLALTVNGETLSLDHGYPARVIVPGLPGVHNTKWVARIDFAGGAAR
ncbi:molybdopterin-dependent oxidoreductase [Rhodococcoides kroppenstedtii]|uniref:molybdopterin-dependent oxidoreductase n=1 Tax=Rhodococcoides kroppenstedtii TaxID=293050 RepID=UPI000945619D|nr:molybdopterin-dependent oxidoreductase [Rhodococcus kroppenstedtii]